MDDMHRLANSDLQHRCSRCGRAFPRMYWQNGVVVCKEGDHCRPGATEKRFRTYEVHGNDGVSPFTHAENLLRQENPNVVVVGSRYTGERCSHGSLLVEVEYTLPTGPAS